MVELTKPITRVIPSIQIKGRPLVVTLKPPDKIHFHEKGKRDGYILPIEACFWLAAKAESERQATLAELHRTRRRRRRKGV